MNNLTEMGLNDIKAILRPHLSHITTFREWNSYSKSNNLPTGYQLIDRLGSWAAVKKMMGVRSSIDEKGLIEIAKQHREHFTTMKKWNEYARLNELPSSQLFISRIGNWNEIKRRLNIEPSTKAYTKNEIQMVIAEHSEHFKSAAHWNDYAKVNKLPNYNTITESYEWREVKQMADVPNKYRYSKNDLIEIAIKHANDFTSVDKWNNYAKDKGLPSSMSYIRKFGSWRKAKHEVNIRI